MSTSVSPDARRIWAAARGPVIIGAIVLAAAIVMSLFRDSQSLDALDPESVAPAGSRAVARLLTAQGIQIQRVDTDVGKHAGVIRPSIRTGLRRPRKIVTVFQFDRHNFADPSGVKHVTKRCGRRQKATRHADGKHASGPVGCFGEPPAGGFGHRQWFFTQDVEAASEGHRDRGFVKRVRQCDDDGLDA